MTRRTSEKTVRTQFEVFARLEIVRSSNFGAGAPRASLTGGATEMLTAEMPGEGSCREE
jgi:hypothetical protein